MPRFGMPSNPDTFRWAEIARQYTASVYEDLKNEMVGNADEVAVLTDYNLLDDDGWFNHPYLVIIEVSCLANTPTKA